MISSLLDAPLVESRISRLVCDCNRALDAPDLVAAESETTPVPGNRDLDEATRRRRIEIAHAPFHEALDEVIRTRLACGRETWLLTVHSFTPVYRGQWRPWEIGIVHDDDERLATPLVEGLRRREPGLKIGRNQPYAPSDGVYYTVERHARPHGLPCAMIEIRNDDIATTAGQRRYGQMLAEITGSIGLAARMPNLA
jgi:predicted N-formylglutamate amidohydrolase